VRIGAEICKTLFTALCVYEEDGCVLGFASFGPSRDDDADVLVTAELMALYVHPKVWNRGIGQSLWQQVENIITCNFTEVTLWVLRDNIRARSFYEAMGLVAETGKEKLLPRYDCELYEIRYQKLLTSDFD
jgi:ribosomal protein S18 acetylase RimI-like enzyme